ncbi:2'-5' RNA ligase family protein [Hymenobacter sp. HSC-4F20]|uniref:2'-5' RNA ligase family protein n=1 Tax=Hymenobacter sp. HSC-4F20 TaxID=2864135 RepID=UPI001C7365F5|nr:2'-5' RNA ligase family protein [Hymenobacter sp. HSC-4F20]MBX0289859.1 2'-5' RNA ligase family protein [Hymenobacter sp. HSC-4F20]
MNLYLVALLPPEPVRGEVWALKQEVHERTGSRNAINLLPHITLVPPLRQPPEFAAVAAESLRAFAAGQSACQVGLQDFAWFQSRTLYVHVVQAAAVQHLHAALSRWCAAHLPAVPPPSRPFVPHVTLATRDLPPAMVPALRAEFASRTYAAQAIWNELVLFRHDGRRWQVQETVYLPARPDTEM